MNEAKVMARVVQAGRYSHAQIRRDHRHKHKWGMQQGFGGPDLWCKTKDRWARYCLLNAKVKVKT